jgi:hypothetical protein
VSIVRVGLAETKKFAAGYEAIFGRKAPAKRQKPKPAAGKKPSPRRKSPKKS